MRVIRGRAETPDADRRVTAELLDDVTDGGPPAVRVWAPHRQIAFGRRDAREDGYEAAREVAEQRGYVALERSVGGRAVAYTGETTLAFAHVVPVDDTRGGLNERYERATRTLLDVFSDLGVDAERGEPDNSFCPGQHSIRADGKVVGVAQRVRTDAALVSGCVLVDDRAELASVLDDVYDALDVPFDPDSVGTVAAASGPSDPYYVARAIEDAFVGDDERDVESIE